jgi:hypothetical protein
MTVTVTRLIRVSYGDYQLQNIPPGMAIPVPVKPVERQRHRGPLFPRRRPKQNQLQKDDEERPSPVQWIRR